MIVVAGEALVDLVVAGSSITATPGGAPYNVARAIARLGEPVALLAGTSTDPFGALLTGGLADAGVDLSQLQPSERPTTLAVAQLDAHGAATYAFYTAGTSAPAVLPTSLPAGTTTLVTGGLGLVLTPMADTIIDLVAGVGDDVLVVVDVNCRPSAVDDDVAYRRRVAAAIARADIVKVSDEDLEYLALGATALDSAQALLDRGAGAVLVTAGAQATSIVTHHGTRNVPVPSATVVDTIGAGDSFTAAFVAWWRQHGHGRDALGDLDALDPAVTAAHVVAAIVVGRRGADPPTRAELPAPW